MVWYYVMHIEGVHTTKHDQIEQHISKKIEIHAKTHKIIIFRPFSQAFLLIILYNQRLVAYKSVLFGCSPVRFWSFFSPMDWTCEH